MVREMGQWHYDHSQQNECTLSIIENTKSRAVEILPKKIYLLVLSSVSAVIGTLYSPVPALFTAATSMV